VPGGIDDPYHPPPPSTGDPVTSYRRTDRSPPGPRGTALPNPDFSGTWSTLPIDSTPPTGRPAPQVTPTLGSGWGDRISIVHNPGSLEIERVIFVPREVQPPVRYRFHLDGSATKNTVTTGRSNPASISTVAWDNHRLVITTQHSYPDPDGSGWRTHEVLQTMWLQPADQSPFEPNLVVETVRGPALGGPASTNRTVYYRGYR
jgi:hypothetical protein